MNNTYAFIAIMVMALVTIALRFLPFVIFGKNKTPEFVVYLGQVLPYAVMGMLVVYCLKDINFTIAPFAVPEVLSVIMVVGIHVWKRNTLLSIIAGTLCYMILIRFL